MRDGRWAGGALGCELVVGLGGWGTGCDQVAGHARPRKAEIPRYRTRGTEGYMARNGSALPCSAPTARPPVC